MISISTPVSAATRYVIGHMVACLELSMLKPNLLDIEEPELAVNLHRITLTGVNFVRIL